MLKIQPIEIFETLKKMSEPWVISRKIVNTAIGRDVREALANYALPVLETSSWPQVGHRSGWASPRGAHTVCQVSATGVSTGGCPSAVRQTARASAWV